MLFLPAAAGAVLVSSLFIYYQQKAVQASIQTCEHHLMERQQADIPRENLFLNHKASLLTLIAANISFLALIAIGALKLMEATRNAMMPNTPCALQTGNWKNSRKSFQLQRMSAGKRHEAGPRP